MDKGKIRTRVKRKKKKKKKRMGREGKWAVQTVQAGADAPFHLQEKKQRFADANQRPGEERRERGGGAGVSLHTSHSIRRSGVCPVHGDVSLRAGERQELPRA